MVDVFASPSEGWSRVSPRLGTVRRLVVAMVMTPLAISALALAAFFTGAIGVVVVAGATAVLAVLVVRLVDRQWRAIGYAERNSDLLVVRGVMFRQLVVVPYGRMQFVDVTDGPLQRRFGLATVQLHTASAATDASIPGLPPVDAAQLRDRLAALGEAKSAGL